MARKKTAKVASIEEARPRDYELVVIANPELDDESLNATISKIDQFVIEREGTVTDTQRWGKKRLAYPINNFREGSYILSQLKLKPATTVELEASLEISEEVLRYLLIRKDSVRK